MTEVYRIKKGLIESGKVKIPFYFGLVFEEDGIFYFDFHTEETFDLGSLMKEEEEDVFIGEFSMSAETEERNYIYATSLYARSVKPNISKLQMVCNGEVTHSKISRGIDREPDEPIGIGRRDPIYYIELEGLKMEFSDITQTSTARSGIKIKDFNKTERDHTNITLTYNSSNSPYSNYPITFFKKDNSDNIIVSFPNHRLNGEDAVFLYYDVFNEFKKDFISLLSFVNGAEVVIRREYTGSSYQTGVINSQTVVTYSFKRLTNKRRNRYVPIDDSRNRVDKIFIHLFIDCFNNFISENKKLDLSSIVFYLNGSTQSSRVQERFFILIIALERIAKKYIGSTNEHDIITIPETSFQPIKDELLAVLRKHGPTVGDKLNSMSGRIGELNRIKGKSIENKFNKLLEYAKIEITPEIKKIIEEVRHESVHSGEIGRGDEGVMNYLVLDKLLRDIILNIIGYNKSRNSRI